jgi:toxin YoeB
MMSPARNLEFDRLGFEDLYWWVIHDSKNGLKIIKLIEAIIKDPYRGIGNPESLRHELFGCWSRRINQEHRLVYKVKEDNNRILSCSYHYSK